MQSRSVEVWVGLFVALGLAALAFLSVRASNLAEYSDGDAYTVVARFDNIGSLRVRAPVTVAGVRVGRVSGIDFDKQQFKAVVRMAIASRYDNLPQDTVASIRTAGLIGEQFVGLDPGGAPDALKDGDEIEITQSALVIEQLIGQFLYGQAAKGDKEGDK
ncbi:outer membrane lipid asymmetry maintenance protein MlaD [Immundisolibacter sp.]|uniref:outer membrane lipid asymmetry maintenance protein MlaD n=1 Tax=Immundisolibacter sp. TaxID=1934948 RepID=UPI00260522FE|nr:outer membrane lipid asymmetry maintenance protein MlaD [Immundisolibacter sp.]MDD3651013.1 outer membrane lipid asymmetry maintenance protein MlaD [Immundisolibacter sp.]